MAKPKELRGQSKEELLTMKSDKEQELFRLRNLVQNKDKDIKPSSIRMIRRDIAQINTILSERK